MNIHAHIIAYNEERILPYTLSHYFSFCSKVFVYDNMSTDKTAEIAASFGAEVIPFDTDNHIDEREYLRIKNYCWQANRDVDFVIVCDADEFLYSEKLLYDLEFCKHFHLYIPRINGYQMYSEIFPEFDPTNSLLHRLIKTGIPDNAFNKQIIFNPNEVERINYLPGCHQCSPVSKTGDKFITDIKINDNGGTGFKLLHYKYLDRELLKARHEAYSQRLSTWNRIRNYGIEYTSTPDFIEKQFNMLRDEAQEII